MVFSALAQRCDDLPLPALDPGGDVLDAADGGADGRGPGVAGFGPGPDDMGGYC